MRNVIFILALFFVHLHLLAQDLQVTNKEPGKLQEQIEALRIGEGAKLTIKGELQKEDVHYLALLTKDKGIKELDLSDSKFGEIGLGLFEGCYQLEVVKLPNTLRTIAKNAFKGCANLRDITLSKNLTSIGKCAFEGCSRLETITLYKKLSWIGAEAFKDSGIKQIKIKGNKTFSFDGIHLKTKEGSIIY